MTTTTKDSGEQSGITARSQKRELDPAPIDENIPPRKRLRSRSGFVVSASKHGMKLRPRSRSVASVPKLPNCTPSGEIQRTIPRIYMGKDGEERRKSAMVRKAWREQQDAWIQEQHVKLWESLGNPDRRFPPPKDLTQREMDICGPYLTKQAFEFREGPIPDEHKLYKTFLDQVRVSPYQVRVQFQGNIYLPAFVPIDKDDLESVPIYRERFKEAVKLVTRAVKKRHRSYKVEDGFNNFIALDWNRLLSVNVRSPTGTLQTVEALFWKSPVEPLKLLEWKVKQGSKVIFCSVRRIT